MGAARIEGGHSVVAHDPIVARGLRWLSPVRNLEYEGVGPEALPRSEREARFFRTFLAVALPESRENGEVGEFDLMLVHE